MCRQDVSHYQSSLKVVDVENGRPCYCCAISLYTVYPFLFKSFKLKSIGVMVDLDCRYAALLRYLLLTRGDL